MEDFLFGKKPITIDIVNPSDPHPNLLHGTSLVIINRSKFTTRYGTSIDKSDIMNFTCEYGRIMAHTKNGLTLSVHNIEFSNNQYCEDHIAKIKKLLQI